MNHNIDELCGNSERRSSLKMRRAVDSTSKTFGDAVLASPTFQHCTCLGRSSIELIAKRMSWNKQIIEGGQTIQSVLTGDLGVTQRM